jgi:hypothetical protein
VLGRDPGVDGAAERRPSAHPILRSADPVTFPSV